MSPNISASCSGRSEHSWINIYTTLYNMHRVRNGQYSWCVYSWYKGYGHWIQCHARDLFPPLLSKMNQKSWLAAALAAIVTLWGTTWTSVHCASWGTYFANVLNVDGRSSAILFMLVPWQSSFAFQNQNVPCSISKTRWWDAHTKLLSPRRI
jgi:hypothetical protein